MIYMTYSLDSGQPTGFITESGPMDTFEPPEGPHILVSEDRYKQILAEPRKYKVSNGQLTYIPDSPNIKRRAELLYKIETQRSIAKETITSGIIIDGYRYETNIESQLNYISIVTCGETSKVWAFSVAKSEWEFIDLSPTEAEDLIKRTQKRREALSEVSHLDLSVLESRIQDIV